MFKLIQFTDTIALWNNELIVVNHVVCRHVQHINLLPTPKMLNFNCKEEDLFSVSDNINIFKEKIRQHHVPDVTLERTRV